MSGHETVVITGKLSRDPETKFSASGTQVTKFSIPVDRKVGDERKPVWWNIVTLGKLAESAHKNLHKGSIVRVEGLMSVDSDTMCPRVFEHEGQHRAKAEMVVNVMTFIDNFGGGEAKPAAEQDELPF